MARMATAEITRKANRFKSLVTPTFSRCIILKNTAWMRTLKTKIIREEVSGRKRVTARSIVLKKSSATTYRVSVNSALITHACKKDIPDSPIF